MAEETTARGDELFNRWLAALEARHLADLRFPEVSRALRALSSTYVERRARLGEGAALSGAGKRAAFALFYGPLHFLLLRHIASEIARKDTTPRPLVDLGCGTGAAAAGWAVASASAPEVSGVDRHPWAVEEARETLRAFGLKGSARVGDMVRAPLPTGSLALAAFSVNELDSQSRAMLLPRLVDHASSGGRVVIVEPLAGRAAPWWREWRQAFDVAGGRDDEWRIRLALPPIVQKLDRAAGLNHREITGRSLVAGF